MNIDSHESDSELVKRALSDKEALAHLIGRYEVPLTRYIHRLGVRDDEDVLDILQDTFIKVYRNLNEFDSSLKFSSWVYRIAHNETMSWFRKRHARPEGHLIDNGDEVMEFMGSDEWGSEERFDATLSAEALVRALDRLDERYREVIVLRFFEHKEYDEISDILKLPLGSVGTLIHRGKKRLRELLNDNLHI